MKKLILIPILLLVIMSCSKSDNNETNIPPELIGKWQMKTIAGEVLLNGGIIDFKNDNTFSSTIIGYEYNSNSPGGTYIVTSTSELILTYSNISTNPAITNKKITLLTSDELILNPTHSNCIEGCAEIFSRNITDNTSGKNKILHK